MDDIRQRAAALSKHVSAVLGGTILSKSFDSQIESAIVERIARYPARQVPLGDLIELRMGVCRHRSILFKYLCDHMRRFPKQWALAPASAASPTSVRGAVPCQLVRGVQSAADGSAAATENHAWNVVQIDDASYVVDVMQRPGELLPVDSKEAQAYQRLIRADPDAVRTASAQVRLHP